MKNEKLDLNKKFQLGKDIYLENDVDGNVVVCIPQNHPIQNFFRKIKFKIPKTKTITLDKIGSRVILNIKEGNSLSQIGENLKQEFSDHIDPLYPRLETYIKQLLFLKIIKEV